MAADSRSGLRAASTPPAGHGIGRAAGIVGTSMMAMNVLAYGAALLAAHLLGPAAFGEVAALLGVIIVANVGSLTLQATAARQLAITPEAERALVRHSVLGTGRTLSLFLGVVLLLAAPLLDIALQLHDWIATAMVAPSCAALTMMGGYAGIAQGQRQWQSLSALYIATGGGRALGVAVALALDPSPRAALIGIAVGSLAPLIVGWRMHAGADRAPSQLRMWGELWRNGHALLALFVLSNLDLLLARHLFTHYDAGIYAAGAIIAKACLFLPSFVVVVAFPSMAADRGGRAWRKPMAVVLLLGGCVVVGTLALPGLAETFAGGSKYTGLGSIAWIFAIEGTIFAALQILVYDSIAGQAHTASLLWAGVVALVVLAELFAQPVGSLAALAAGVGAVVTVCCRLLR